MSPESEYDYSVDNESSAHPEVKESIASSDDDNDDVDVSLTPGEVKCVMLQKAIPDDEGFFECNPNEVEINAADLRERRYRIRRGNNGKLRRRRPSIFQTHDQREEDTPIARVTSRPALRVSHGSQDPKCR